MNQRQAFVNAARNARRAAIDAERNRDEMLDVLAELEAAINADTSPGTFALYRHGTGLPRVLPTGSLAERVAAGDTLSIVTRGASERLCAFVPEARVYPIQIGFSNRVFFAHDREDLASILAKALEEPHIGRFLNQTLGPLDAAKAPDPEAHT